MQKINRLGERTHQIGSITETVKDLSDQSNMLALNAAREAVHSGAHGGYVTARIREILDDIGGAVRQAVAITERGAERMEAGLAQVQTSGRQPLRLGADPS